MKENKKSTRNNNFECSKEELDVKVLAKRLPEEKMAINVPKRSKGRKKIE